MTRGVDRISVTSVTENYVDMLLPDAPNVMRPGLIHHFDPKRLPINGENGIAMHVEVDVAGHPYRVLFDTGMTSRVLLYNARALGIDLGLLDHVVISHGHPDHYGGLLGMLESREAPLPISINGDAFLPRYLRLASGAVAPYYNQDLSVSRIDNAGGRLVMHQSPLEIGPGMIASGEIPREVDFEQPNKDLTAPNALIYVHNGNMCADVVPDDQALIIEIGRDGLIILVGCSHAGVINTIRHAIKITGRDRIVGVFGGFHLGFPGTPESKTTATIEALRDIGVETLCPMHCTGMQAMMALQVAFPEQFLLNCAGCRVFLEATPPKAVGA